MKNNKSLYRDEKLFGIILFDMMVQYAAIILFLFVALTFLPHKESDGSVMAGRVCAELYWDNNRNIDIDLWGTDPVDKEPIGYSNMHGRGMDLFRDVIGFSFNPEHINMEIMCSNRITPGEWTFDVSYYSDHEVTTPNHDSSVDAVVIIRLKNKNGGEIVKKATWRLTHEKEDKTMFNFIIDKNGDIVENSINTVNKYLAVGKK